MSLIKDLREHPKNNINLTKVFELISPEGKSKYVQIVHKIFHNEGVDINLRDVREQIKNSLPFVTDDELNKLSEVELIVCHHVIQSMSALKIKTIREFFNHNETKLISGVDLSQIKSFKQIQHELRLVKDKIEEKENEKQIKKLYEDDEWLILRPLTYKSSCKYGSNTKWCTTSGAEIGSESYFNTHAEKDILIYTINKRTNKKVATKKKIKDNSLSKDSISFWNEIDHRIDSFQTDLPRFILEIIFKECKESKKGNKELFEKKAISISYGYDPESYDFDEEGTVDIETSRIPTVKDYGQGLLSDENRKILNDILGSPKSKPIEVEPTFSGSTMTVYHSTTGSTIEERPLSPKEKEEQLLNMLRSKHKEKISEKNEKRHEYEEPDDEGPELPMDREPSPNDPESPYEKMTTKKMDKTDIMKFMKSYLNIPIPTELGTTMTLGSDLINKLNKD
jgi:hypothetical protein